MALPGHSGVAVVDFANAKPMPLPIPSAARDLAHSIREVTSDGLR
jgi:hypothetical protein